MFMILLVAIMLFLLWGAIGEIGWLIWREKVLKTCNLTLATKRAMFDMKLLSHRNKFRTAGPFGLYTALKHSTGDKNV